MGLSAMLAEEYILIDISLLTLSWCDFSSQHQFKFIQHQHFYLSLVTGLDVTQNISTSERFCVNFKAFYLNFIFLLLRRLYVSL
jgi:hypothetical protein